VAYALNDRRDVGAGLVTPRRGPANAAASLAGPGALLVRLQRGTVVGWAVALLLLGLTFGSLAKSVTGMVADIPALADAVGAAGDLIDGFAAAASMYFALCASAFAVASLLRLRGEETAGRTELMLGTALDRRRYLGAGITVTAVAAALLLIVAGLADGLATAAVLGDAGRIGPQLLGALVFVPAVLVVAGVAAALVGLAPRFAPLAWLVVVWSMMGGLFGPLLDLPAWALRLSPLGWVSKVPAEDVDVLALTGLLVVAVGLIAAAVAGFRRRDVPS
jgi:ABC-2 type transport system permease protein